MKVYDRLADVDVRLGEFTPMPKNPIIADFFVQVGIAEKLGSGLQNLVKASHLYTGKEPEFSDGDVFRDMVPISRDPTARGLDNTWDDTGKDDANDSNATGWGRNSKGRMMTIRRLRINICAERRCPCGIPSPNC